MTPTYDPKKKPFIETKKDIVKVFGGLPGPTNIAFAISALAGLRPGEVRELKWTNVDLDRRRIYVRESANGPTKDKDGREAPIVPGLHDLLVVWSKEPRASTAGSSVRRRAGWWARRPTATLPRRASEHEAS